MFNNKNQIRALKLHLLSVYVPLILPFLYQVIKNVPIDTMDRLILARNVHCVAALLLKASWVHARVGMYMHVPANAIIVSFACSDLPVEALILEII